jgi:hypothetical protein
VDAHGKLVATAPLAVHKGANKIKLGWLNAQPPGYYLIKIKCAAGVVTGKVLVTK